MQLFAEFTSKWVIVMLLTLGVRPAANPTGAAQSAQQTPETKPAGVQASAQKFLELLAKEQYAEATKHFDDVMTKAMPAEKLGETWKGLLKAVGPFKKQAGIRTQRTDKYEIVFVTCEFANSSLDAKVVFGADGKITGLFFTPTKKAVSEYQVPDYVRREAFQDKEVRIGAGEWALPGSLTIPNGKGPFPAVVLIHGSGPHDRDELIGPNRPFRDLAWGLASRGVVVLRFEKRTKEHGAKLVAQKIPVTIKEEVLDDALAAVAFLRGQPAVDGKKVFVLGHSLGAVLCPKLGTLDPEVAGLICLAGATRRIEDVVVDQFNYLAALDPATEAQGKEQVEKIKAQVARLKDPNLSREAAATETLLGAPFAYWLSLRGNYPTDVISGVKQPMLILQGERDYQVTMEDFEGWKKALAGRKNATFKSYPKLYHLFIAGEGKSKPAEYQKPGSVAREVIDDIADWITKQHP